MNDLTIISVDDHVIEPPSLWEGRVPAKFRERAPRLLRLRDVEPGDTRVPQKMQAAIDRSPDGIDFWSYEGILIPINGLGVSSGKKRDEYSFEPANFETLRPGYYDPMARIADMDLDGVLGSLSFPSFPRFAGQLFSVEGTDRELAMACIAGYNDWMIDEWAGSAPGRLIPMSIIPMWDPSLAVAEMQRTAAKGAKAVSFSENPGFLGFPSIHDKDGYWDPVFSAAEDLDTPLCMHIGSSSTGPSTAPDAPMSIYVALAPFSSQATLMDWLLSGVLIRHPRLKLALSEGGIGWIPYVLDRADYSWEHQGAWTNTPLKEPPSTYFTKHFYGCFIDDPHGSRCIHEIGVDNVMMESDYPHSDSTWPTTLVAARKALAGLDAEATYKVSRGNAERVFNFTPSAIGST